MSAGVYTYTVTGTAPCPDEQATVTVTINTPPDPGVDGAITLCSTDAPASLFAQLGGTPDAGGTWTGPSPVVGGMIDPGTMSAGAYTYTSGTHRVPDDTGHGRLLRSTRTDDGAITLCSGRSCFALRTTRRNSGCWRHMDRTESCGRWHDQPGDDERRCLHLHRYRYRPMPG